MTLMVFFETTAKRDLLIASRPQKLVVFRPLLKEFFSRLMKLVTG
jgi:hypothetical protein